MRIDKNRMETKARKFERKKNHDFSLSVSEHFRFRDAVGKRVRRRVIHGSERINAKI